MSVIDLGAPVTSIWAGAPSGGTYAVSLTRPDGTSLTPPAINSGPPASVEFLPDMAGRWMIRWTSSGTGTAGAYSDVVDVWPADPKFIISVDDAKNALNMYGSIDPNTLDDLRLYIAAATPVIEDIVGAITVRNETQHVAKGWSYAALYQRAATLTSVVFDDATTVPADLYEFDSQAGLLEFHSPLPQGATITYSTGAASIPQNIRLGTRELVRHWWQLGKQTTRHPAVGASPAEAWTPSGFAVPKRVIELCQPSKRLGGFA